MSLLARYAHLHQEPDPAKAKALAREAWQKHGIVLLRPEWLPGPIGQKWALEAMAISVHGPRKQGDR